ncbi:MAG TPA: pilus assembly protein [Caulobacter sp.]|nr:pilus assembly protein [Caulobacter sp.]
MLGRWTTAAWKRLKSFAERDDGAIAVQAAFLGAPLLVLTMGAVDIANASAAKTRLQDALDAAALTAARSSQYSDAGLDQVGDAAMAANMQGSQATLTGSSFRAEGNKVIATASAEVAPTIASLWLQGDIAVGAKAEVTRSVNKIELALVLDTTGSMKGDKLSNLKTAAKNLIDTLSRAAARSSEADPVKIAIAPFSMTVRVGEAYRHSSWIDQNGASPINDQIFNSSANRFTLLQQMGVGWGGCVESRQAPYDVQDTAPDVAAPATLFTPFFAPDEPSASGYYNSYLPDVTTNTNWKFRQGYVAKYVQAPARTGINTDTGYLWGPNAGCQLSPVTRLTTDWASLKTGIDAMVAVGDTNIPLGLMWGWHLLSPNAPFGDGRAYGAPKSQKIVILMTDGDNTMGSTGNNNASLYNSLGYIWQGRLGITSGSASQRRSAMDGRLATLCANMKAQGIVLYTVRVEVTSGDSSLLRNCASSAEKFYDVQDASQLNAVFDAIAGSIENLRILK